GVAIEDLQSWNHIPNPNMISAGNTLIVPAPASSSETGKSYTIKTGDTLGAIAYDRGVTIEDLQSWNHIPNPNRIFAGNTLIVPAPASSSEAGKSYTIKTGDTLWAIAHENGVTIEDLQSWNYIPNPNMIFPGNTLIVRQGTRNTPAAPASPSGAGESYTIKTGDALWAIARDHGVTIEDLQSWNHIPNPNRIFAGNTLIVPAPASSSETGKSYTIKTGDTLGAISYDRGVTIEDLQSWNHIPNPNRIFAGNTLIVRE
ncbi:unnamed protein product, partial [Ascophyllum nodosum]